MLKTVLSFSFVVLPVLAGILSTSRACADSPPVHREGIEWCDLWITDGGGTKLPRVLLIGDSITRGYGSSVEALLKGKASVSRLATSKSVGDPVLLEEVALVLKQYHWDVVHFNNGLHGWEYTEEDYKRSFPDFIGTIRKYAPDAKLIWATTTPMRSGPGLSEVNPRTDRVKERNRIAAEIVTRENIPTDDLFSLLDGRPEYYSGDGVHSNGKGVEAEATKVADSITKLLPTVAKND